MDFEQVCLLSEAGDVLPEGEEETWEEEEDAQVVGEEPPGEPGGGGGVGHADDGGETRSLNNPKGTAELEAIANLGFPLLFKGYSIKAGIILFDENKIQQQHLGKYGLEVARPGKKAPPPPDPAPHSLSRCVCAHRCGRCAGSWVGAAPM